MTPGTNLTRLFTRNRSVRATLGWQVFGGPRCQFTESGEQRLPRRREFVLHSDGRAGVDGPRDQARTSQFGQSVREHGVADLADCTLEFRKSRRTTEERRQDHTVPAFAEKAESASQRRVTDAWLVLGLTLPRHCFILGPRPRWPVNSPQEGLLGDGCSQDAVACPEVARRESPTVSGGVAFLSEEHPLVGPEGSVKPDRVVE